MIGIPRLSSSFLVDCYLLMERAAKTDWLRDLQPAARRCVDALAGSPTPSTARLIEFRFR